MGAGNGVSVMSGYRDRSNFDPYATPRYGRPLRPFNWVQWAGVAFVVIGLALDVLYFAGRLGWNRSPVNGPIVALAPIFLGISLVNTRREVVADPAPELASARKRWMLIVLAICFAVLGAAIAIDFKGA